MSLWGRTVFSSTKRLVFVCTKEHSIWFSILAYFYHLSINPLMLIRTRSLFLWKLFFVFSIWLCVKCQRSVEWINNWLNTAWKSFVYNHVRHPDEEQLVWWDVGLIKLHEILVCWLFFNFFLFIDLIVQ